MDLRDGEPARRKLAAEGWLDITRRPQTRDGRLLLPVTPDAPTDIDLGVDQEWTEFEFERRERRPTTLREAPNLPPELASEVTRSMDVVGDIAVLRLKDDIRPRATEIGEALMEVHPRLRAVAVDSGVQGELRVRSLEIVSGEGPLVTVHREQGMELRVDLERAYFSPRLATEHQRIADMVSPGERVLDMFTGVGPFAVLVAKQASGAEVHAVDLNEAAVQLARENVEVNGVAPLVTVHQGDARELVPTLGVFDRIIMNHPSGARSFIDTALAASGPGTVVHLKAVGLGGLDQRVQVGAGCHTLDRCTEQPVFATHHERPDGILCAIVVDFQSAIIQIANQLVPFTTQVVHGLAGCTGWRHQRQTVIQPVAQFIQYRTRLLLAILPCALTASLNLRRAWAMQPTWISPLVATTAL